MRLVSRVLLGTASQAVTDCSGVRLAHIGKKRKQSEPPATSPPPPPPAAAGAGTAEDGNKRRKRVKTTEEPADVEEKDVKAATQRRKVAFTRLIEQLQEEKYSHYFESRVTKSIAPMYNVAVRRPTCLKDVLRRSRAARSRIRPS